MRISPVTLLGPAFAIPCSRERTVGAGLAAGVQGQLPRN